VNKQPIINVSGSFKGFMGKRKGKATFKGSFFLEKGEWKEETL